MSMPGARPEEEDDISLEIGLDTAKAKEASVNEAVRQNAPINKKPMSCSYLYVDSTT